MNKGLSIFALLPILFAASFFAHSAKPIDLNRQPLSLLNAFTAVARPGLKSASNNDLKETSRSVDFKHTLHVRIQQTYAGHPVFGADGVIHLPGVAHSKQSFLSLAATPKSSMDGTLYQELDADLANTPAAVLSTAQAEKAASRAATDWRQRKNIKTEMQTRDSKLIVYVDDKNKAHWAFRVNLSVPMTSATDMPSRPVYIIDASTLDIYKRWDKVKTAQEKSEGVLGGGFGGNKKMGKLVYDGLKDHLSKLNIKRDAESGICYLQNDEILVQRYEYEVRNPRHPRNAYDVGSDFNFKCEKPNEEHDNIYWNDSDQVNGGYSPANDALFQGEVVKKMYREWYKQEILMNGNRPAILKMIVHKPMANAYWDSDARQMVFGDGKEFGDPDIFYPFTSLGITAHEISHVFTEVHSDLEYEGQSGGINESFSDMASKAAEIYAYGKNINWELGAEIFKTDEAIRYFEKPSKDCQPGAIPGMDCSIDEVREYQAGSPYTDPTDVHYSSGIYNRVFYLMATAEGWDTKKAFDVMVEANMHYWTTRSNFATAACGVVKATNAYGYDVQTVHNAFKKVGIDATGC